jgi:hypothetical protein
MSATPAAIVAMPGPGRTSSTAPPAISATPAAVRMARSFRVTQNPTAAFSSDNLHEHGRSEN